MCALTGNLVKLDTSIVFPCQCMTNLCHCHDNVEQLTVSFYNSDIDWYLLFHTWCIIVPKYHREGMKGKFTIHNVHVPVYQVFFSHLLQY